MAPILFDVANAKEKRQFSFTFGKSRETSRWVERRRFEFGQLAEFLRKPPEVGQKDGDCYTPALFSGVTRNLQYTTQIDLVVLDSDCGHELEYIKRSVAAKGWRAIIHSTHSHMTTQTAFAASAFRKWQSENPSKSVGDYFIAKKGFLPEIMQDAFILDEVAEGKGANLIISHAPCPKFRILLPLHKPWLAEEYESQDMANATWRERIGALAYSLGLYHDQSCSDTSRLFYFPRVRNAEALADYVCEVLPGEDCDLWGLPDARTAPQPDAGGMASLFDQYGRAPLAGRQGGPGGNVVALTPRGHTAAIDKKTYVNPDTGEIFDLTAWALRYGPRFEIVKAIKARKPEIIAPRKQGVKSHIYCVRSGDHMTGGLEGTGTYIVNASELSRANLPSISAGFVIHCMHNGCSGIDRLDHVKALLETGTLSVDDLTNPEFLSSDFSTVDITPLINKLAEKKDGSKEKESVSQAQIEREGDSNIAAYLYKDLPGVLGEIHKFMLASAPKPQPVLALGAALAFAATVIGQRVKLQHFGTRPNIYILGIGVSGSGKDRPMTACKQIARASGLYKELIGVEEVASDTGIVASVLKNPRQLMLIDEASFLLNAVSDPRAGTHMKDVVKTLLKLYSSSSTTFQGKSYADIERTKFVDQPCVSFYGASTPRGLSDALTNKDIESGLLSRMVIFDAGTNDPRIRIPDNSAVPDEIAQWINAWHAVKPIPNIMATFGGDPVIAPRVVMLTDEAQSIAMDFEGEMHDAKGKARAKGKDALYVRAFENALKFALIRACAIWPVANEAGNGLMVDESALRVDAETMRWAIDLSRTTVARMDATTDDIADTPYEQSLKALRKTIERAGARGMTIRELSKTPAGRMPERQRTELLNTLYDAFEVRPLKLQAGNRGRPREAYIHKKFFKEYALPELEDDEDDPAAMAGE